MSKTYNQRQPMPNGMETVEFANRRKKNRKARKLAKDSKRKNRR
jgi:hypothetical protein